MALNNVPGPELVPPGKGAGQFIIALVIVLVGVVLGYFLVRGHEGPRPTNKPTALGHRAPIAPAARTNAPTP